MSNSYITKNGSPVILGQVMGRGGEATVYAVNSSTVAKVYNQPQAGPKEHKLEAMVENPPPTKDKNSNLALVWPQELLYGNNGALVGFTMPKAEEGHCPIFNYWNNSQLKKLLGIPEDDWENLQDKLEGLLLAIGWNFVTIVSSLHERNYIIGDINESNIMVGLTGRIAILDPDSFQIYDAKRRVIHRCVVGREEYTDPNLMRIVHSDRKCPDMRCVTKPGPHSQTYGCVDRTLDHDNFAIAVVLFRLIIGRHPFDTRDSDSTGYQEKIVKRLFPYVGDLSHCPPDLDQRWMALDGNWQEYFTETFTTDRRYEASVVSELFEKHPPLSAPNLGAQHEVDLGLTNQKPEPPGPSNVNRTQASPTRRQPARPANTASNQPIVSPQTVRQQPGGKSAASQPKPVVVDYVRQGQEKLDARDYNGAILDCSKALSLANNDVSALLIRGEAYRNQNDHHHAILDFSKVVSLSRDNAQAYNLRGLTYLNAKDYNKSIEDFDAGITLIPEDPIMWCNRGLAYHWMNQIDQAFNDYSRSIGIRSSYGPARIERGQIYLGRGQLDLAIADFDQAIAWNRNDAFAWNNRGVAYFHKKKDGQAIEDYKQALRLLPSYNLFSNNLKLARVRLWKRRFRWCLGGLALLFVLAIIIGIAG